MKILLSLFLVALIVLAPLVTFSQEGTAAKTEDKPQTTTEPIAATPSAIATTNAPKPALVFGLAENTPVRLRINRTVSSGTEKVNDKVDFSVVNDVKIGDVLVIPQGSLAFATVTKATPKRRMGRTGKLNMNIDYVLLASGEKVALRATKGGSGGSKVPVMTAAIAATGILFLPAAPFFLFMKGKNIAIAKGTEITAYVATDTSLDPAKFANNDATASAINDSQLQAESVPASSLLSMITAKSDPNGAEITVDGKFMGSTPSTLQLAPGEYTFVIAKAGYKSWQRTMTLSASGKITLDAALQKDQ